MKIRLIKLLQKHCLLFGYGLTALIFIPLSRLPGGLLESNVFWRVALCFLALLPILLTGIFLKSAESECLRINNKDVFKIPLLFPVIYLAAHVFIIWADVWHRWFSVANMLIYLMYNLSRLIIAAGILLSCAGAGLLLRKYLFDRTNRLKLIWLDYFIIDFYAGAALLTIVILAAGYLSLYNNVFALLLTLPLIICGYGYFRHITSFLKRITHTGISLDKGNCLQRITLGLCAGAFLISLFFLLTLKALPPGGGGDFNTHYLPYYREVLDLGHIWPNNVWYHYYISKGEGLIFIAGLLTDIHSAPLIGMIFVVIAAVTLLRLVDMTTRNTAFALSTAAALLFAYIYTAGERSAEIWGYLQKPHAITSSMIAGFLFVLIHFLRKGEVNFRFFGYAGGLILAGLFIRMPSIAGLLLPFLGLYFIYYLLRRKWKKSLVICGMGAISGIGLTAILVINFLTTGLFEITPFRLFVPLGDESLFSSWVSPYILVYLEEGSAPSMGGFKFEKLLGDSTWWDKLMKSGSYAFFSPNPILVQFLLLAGITSLILRKRKTSIITVAVIGIFLLTSYPFSRLVDQPVSIIRLYEFTIFLNLVLIAVLGYHTLSLALNNPFIAGLLKGVVGKLQGVVSKRYLKISTPSQLTYLLMCLLSSYLVIQSGSRALSHIDDGFFKSSLRFSLGKSTFLQGYLSNDQENVGGFFMPGLDIAGDMGPEKRVLFFNCVVMHHSAPIVPGIRLEQEVSWAYKDMGVMAYGTPQQAVQAFKKEGINYFLIDMESSNILFGAIPYSQLFDPAVMGDYLKIDWTDGRFYLLTWRKKGENPIPASFLNAWSMIRKENGPFEMPLIQARVQDMYERWDGTSFPVNRNSPLPRGKGWQ